MQPIKVPTLYCSACLQPLTVGVEPIKTVRRGQSVEVYMVVVDACRNCDGVKK